MSEFHAINIRREIATIAIVIYIATVATLVYISNAAFEAVFVGTIPILVYTTIVFLLLKRNRIEHIALWITPIFLSLGFYLVWQSNAFAFLSKVDGAQLAFFDAAVCYLINVFLLLFQSTPKKVAMKTIEEAHDDGALEKVHAQLTELESEHGTKATVHHAPAVVEVPASTMELTLHSIEDKCKAINATIGRVLNVKKGATKEMREDLKIPPDLYNAFSQVNEDMNHENAEYLYDLLQKIRDRLKRLSESIDIVFTPDMLKHLNLKFPEDGSASVIALLAENDSDPVASYHEESLKICNQLMERLEHEHRFDHY